MRTYRLITGNRAYADRMNERPLKGPEWRLDADIDDDGKVAEDQVVLIDPDGEALHRGPILLNTRMNLEVQIRMHEAGRRAADPAVVPEASAEVAAAAEPARPAPPEVREAARAERQVGQALRAAGPAPETKAPGETLLEIPIAQISYFPGGNVREIFQDLDELAADIKRRGIETPLTVNERDGRYTLIAGERRLRAAGKAGLTTVTCRVRHMTDASALEWMLVENLQRQDLTPVEESRAYQRLLSIHGDQASVATAVGKQRSHVNEYLQLLDLPEIARPAVARKELSVRAALEGLRRTKNLPDTARTLVFEALVKQPPSARDAPEAVGKALKEFGNVVRTTFPKNGKPTPVPQESGQESDKKALSPDETAKSADETRILPDNTLMLEGEYVEPGQAEVGGEIEPGVAPWPVLAPAVDSEPGAGALPTPWQVRRRGELQADGYLQLTADAAGSVTVTVTQDREPGGVSVKFFKPGNHGASLRTLAALHELMAAMKVDNDARRQDEK